MGMPRKYEQRKRAEQQQETRERIIAAAVGLHAEIGPARTTLSAVAERAGVQRNTLYRHFPDERSLLFACSGKFTDEHPLPDAEGWRAVGDPTDRAKHGLRELYAYWQANEQLITSVARDAQVSPLVREVNQLRTADQVAAMRAALLEGWPGRRRKRREAVADLALSFPTWQSLVRRSGLSVTAAADLMASLLAAAEDAGPR